MITAAVVVEVEALTSFASGCCMDSQIIIRIYGGTVLVAGDEDDDDLKGKKLQAADFFIEQRQALIGFYNLSNSYLVMSGKGKIGSRISELLLRLLQCK